MIILSGPEAGEGAHAHLERRGGFAQFPGRSHQAVARLHRLGGTGGEDHRAIRITAITELAVAVEGIDVAPVSPQQALIAELGVVEAHPHTLLIARATAGHLLIGGVRLLAAAVAAHHIQHAGKHLQIVLQAPEAAAGKHRLLGGRQSRRPRGEQQGHRDQQAQKPDRKPGPATFPLRLGGQGSGLPSRQGGGPARDLDGRNPAHGHGALSSI